VLLSEVVTASQAVASTRSRTAKVRALAAVLASGGPLLAPVVAGFLIGRLRQGKVGVGWAAAWTTEAAPAAAPGLTVERVDEAVEQLASLSGPGSQARRRAILSGLLAAATREEQDFLRRLFVGEMRQGALEGLMVEAVASAAGVDGDLVRRAAMMAGDLGEVAALALAGGAPALALLAPAVLRPLRPMLAHTAPDAATAVAAVGEASVEWKLDGARIQVHRAGDEVRVFTRSLNEVTDRLPAVVEVARSLPVERVVLDGEAVALDAAGRPRPFQETMSGFGSDEVTPEVPLQPFFFDVLHLDGVDLVDRPLRERLAVLDRVVPEPHRIPRLTTSDPQAAERFLAEARDGGHEGVMVKALDSRYEAGRRGAAWLKVKPAYTLDLVVLAAEWGYGRRTGYLSNLHLGARDPRTGGFVMLGKTFKGLTDRMLAWQTERFLAIEARRTRSTVFVRPEVVVEVAFDGVQASSRYPGGMVLRFARVKGYRPDKAAAEADTIEAVRAIFQGRA
jgi:DNA ligase-1